ncbi:hypothetical protein, partial [Stenotrophomonas geniculata]|uniref:hypothetical protein n=1 Tax=Stenotrophomonas geniculata TaxID=86188 RepID=UPI0039B018B6
QIQQTQLQQRPGAHALHERLDVPTQAALLTHNKSHPPTNSTQLDREHWQTMPAAPGPPPAPARLQAAANDNDPAKLPPIPLDNPHLKFG